MRTKTFTPASPLGRFVNSIDSYLHRINIIYLVIGYYPKYSLAVATVFFLVAVSFAFPTERPLYCGIIAFTAQSVSFLMVTSGIFRLSGGVFSQRPCQQEWIVENIKDILHLLLGVTHFVKVMYILLALELILQLSKRMRDSECVCVLLLVWIAWLLLKEWKLFLLKENSSKF